MSGAPRDAGRAWRFAGYAALFDRVDHGGDLLRPEAFGAVPQRVPLLAEHRAPVGMIETLAVDGTGLRVMGRADRPVTVGEGLSFGYRVLASRQGAWRELLSVELLEVSLTTHPMQPGARVLAVQAPP